MDVSIFRPKVLEILRSADLETISAKKVRKQLSEQLGLDFTPYKKELDDLVKECFLNFTDESPRIEATPAVKAEVKSESDSSEKTVKTEESRLFKADPEESDAQYARMLQEQFSAPRASRSIATPKRKRPSKKRKAEGDDEKVKKRTGIVVNNGFNKLLTLSDDMADLMGVAYLSRPQVTKQIWAYIKAHGLQDPSDKRYIHCDAVLERLLGTSRVHMFTMTKLLQKHMIDDGTAPIGYGTGDVKNEPSMLNSESEEEDRKENVQS